MEIHTSDGTLYRTRMSLGELEKNIGDGFIKVHRGCILIADRDIHFTKNSSDAATAFARYFGTQ